MNTNTISVECAHRLHSSCTFEDCACKCHRFDIDPPEVDYSGYEDGEE